MLRELGHAELAAERAREVAARFAEMGSPSGIADAVESLGLAYHQLERWDDSVEQLDRASRMYHDLGDELSEALARAFLARSLTESGRVQEAVGHVQRAMELSAATRPGRIRAEILGAAATVSLGLGDPPAAHRHADEAHAIAVQVGVFRQQIVALIARAAAARAMGDERAAADDASAARGLAARYGFGYLKGRAERLLAEVPGTEPNSLTLPAQESASSQRKAPERRSRRSRRANTAGPV